MPTYVTVLLVLDQRPAPSASLIMINQPEFHAATEKGVRRSDPQRRERIIAACLDVIAEAGVAGATHRKIAMAADVPLGSMTYHFSGMDELLREAFTRFADTVGKSFEDQLSAAADFASAKASVVRLATEDAFGGQRGLVLSHELYTLAARDPRFRDITHAGMSRCRRALEQHFDPVTARLLDALVKGLTIHRALTSEPQDTNFLAEAVTRITCRSVEDDQVQSH